MLNTGSPVLLWIFGLRVSESRSSSYILDPGTTPLEQAFLSFSLFLLVLPTHSHKFWWKYEHQAPDHPHLYCLVYQILKKERKKSYTPASVSVRTIQPPRSAQPATVLWHFDFANNTTVWPKILVLHNPHEIKSVPEGVFQYRTATVLLSSKILFNPSIYPAEKSEKKCCRFVGRHFLQLNSTQSWPISEYVTRSATAIS